MKTAVCATAKLENQYIREWIEHYKSIGFDNVILYDNNDLDGEELKEPIKDYISSGFVKIFDLRGKKIISHVAYNHCYNKFQNDYDWIFFCDVDEFLTFNPESNITTIEELINFNPLFKTVDVIHINWLLFGDNGLIINDKRKLSERFTTPIYPLDKLIRFKEINWPENCHIKSLVKGGLNNLFNKIIFSKNVLYITHSPIINNLRICHVNGENVKTKNFMTQLSFYPAFICHYLTKTLDEWVNIKMKRGYPDCGPERSVPETSLDVFFKYNEKTPEKLEYLKSIGINYE